MTNKRYAQVEYDPPHAVLKRNIKAPYAWTDEQLADPRMAFPVETLTRMVPDPANPALLIAEEYQGRRVGDDVLGYRWLRQENQHGKPGAGQKLGDEATYINLAAGTIQFVRGVVPKEAEDVAADQDAAQAERDELLLKLPEQIDNEAGEARMRFVTDVPGQQGTYILKGDEAKQIVAILDGNPAATIEPADFPMVAAEATYCGETIQVRAALINATRLAWIPIAAEIEGKRMSAKEAVQAAYDADDRDGMLAAAAAIAWPVPA